ncbi:MAG: hypothetical protein ABI862_06905, partial [Ilumatobacteraceae bacterium]
VAPMISALMSMPVTTSLPRPPRTTVSQPGEAVAMPVTTMAAMRAAATELAPASLVLSQPRAIVGELRTLLPTGSPPLTRLASSPVAAVANGRPGLATFERLQAMSANLSKGTVLRDGEIVVIAAGSRPTDGSDLLEISGGSCRVISLAAGGNVLVDDVLQAAPGQGSLTVKLPPKTERVVLAAAGDQAAVGGVLDGWYRGQTLPLIGWDMALAAAAVVRFESHKAPDNSQRSNGGWANTRDLVRAARVTTRFDRPVHSIAVAIDDVVGADAAAAIDMRLVGAVRVLGPDDRPVDPIILVQGLRSVLVYGIESVEVTDPGVLDPNVMVVVENCRKGQLAGVAASLGSPEQLVESLSLAGFDAAVATPLAGGTGTRTVAWVQNA